MSNCKHSDIYVSVRMNGWATCLMDSSGEVYSTDMENVRRTFPKTGICAECGKRVPVNYGRLRGMVESESK